MSRVLSILTLSLLLAGCSTVPFETEPKADFQGLEPSAVVTDFSESVGTHFELLESVVFKFFGREFTGMGYLSIDPSDRAYALSCMTPTGIKLFELTGLGDDVQALFVPPPMEKHRARFAEAVGRDLRRIYFDWEPPPGAQVKQKKDRLIFKDKTDSETTTYTFSGAQKCLTEKRFSKGWKTRCVVHYFDYEEVDGRLYPKGIILYNKAFHYRMVLRVKEIYPAQTSE